MHPRLLRATGGACRLGGREPHRRCVSTRDDLSSMHRSWETAQSGGYSPGTRRWLEGYEASPQPIATNRQGRARLGVARRRSVATGALRNNERYLAVEPVRHDAAMKVAGAVLQTSDLMWCAAGVSLGAKSSDALTAVVGVPSWSPPIPSRAGRLSARTEP